MKREDHDYRSRQRGRTCAMWATAAELADVVLVDIVEACRKAGPRSTQRADY